MIYSTRSKFAVRVKVENEIKIFFMFHLIFIHIMLAQKGINMSLDFSLQHFFIFFVALYLFLAHCFPMHEKRHSK